MSSWLIALDKQPGIWPVIVGETWRRLMAKCLLKVAGPEAKTACGTTQLTGGLEVGIEGAIHAMRVLSEEHQTEEDCIYSDRAVKGTNAAPVGENGDSGQPTAQPQEFKEQKGDLIIRDLWQQGTNSVHNMRVVNTDSLT